MTAIGCKGCGRITALDRHDLCAVCRANPNVWADLNKAAWASAKEQTK